MMKKSEYHLDDLKMLHHAGKAAEARSGYLALLADNPDDIEVLHLLGLLCAEEGKTEDALVYLHRAAQLAPQHTPLRLHYANMLKAAGQYGDAESELRAILASDEKCAPAYNNLGTVYFARGEFDLACDVYQQALELRPDYVDAYFNLGLAESRRKRDDAAILAYRAVLGLFSQHLGAHFQLGSLLMKRQKYSDAAREFQAVIDHHPDHFESLANIATCTLRQGKVEQAAAMYLRALEVEPADRDTLFNLAVIYTQQGYTRDAVNFYLRLVQLHPDFYDAHYNLGAIYLMARDQESALQHYREALRIRPQDETARHMIRILNNDQQVDESAPAYIESLFDSYANYYDAHMRGHLQYQVPEKLLALMQDTGVLQDRRFQIIDIGCGTGLCGAVFKSHAAQMAGVDLSANMLEIAAQKNLYDELITADIIKFLSTRPDAYDLALAGDVLVYYGRLESLITAVQTTLKSGGYFAFNIETGAASDFVLTPSGRFSHHPAYLEKLARDHGFSMIAKQSVALRRQESGQAPGCLYLWRKA